MSRLLIVNFNIVQLTNFYSHLGFIRQKTNYFLKKFILGFHFNHAIINLSYTLFFLKSVIFIISNILLKNGKILLFSETPELFYYESIDFFFRFFKISYCLRRWQNNMLTRFKWIFGYEYIDYEKSIYLNSIPDLILVTPYNYYHVIKNLSLESQKLLIPSINLIDTIHNPLFFNYFLLTNLKTFKSKHFFLKIFEQIIIKNLLLKKQDFVYKIFYFFIKNEKTI